MPWLVRCALSSLLDSPSSGRQKGGKRYAEHWQSPSLGRAKASSQKQGLLEMRGTRGGKNITQLDVLCLGNGSEEQEKGVGAEGEAFSAGIWGDDEAMRKGKIVLCGCGQAVAALRKAFDLMVLACLFSPGKT